MCCFSGRVDEVKNTRIFARIDGEGRQSLIYQMSLNAPQEVAMVLPIPVAAGAGERAVQFLDFSKYPIVFEHLHQMFPDDRRNALADPFGAPRVQAAGAILEVVSVGAFDASFVPTISDFARLDERFRLPEQVWKELPGYRDFGFAVFKLKPGRAEVHPMAFSFPTATPRKVFFPTLHIHDGKVHEKETFDHTLYLQGEGMGALRGGWRESPGIAVAKVKCGLAHHIIRPEWHVHRLLMAGKHKNGDVVVPF